MSVSAPLLATKLFAPRMRSSLVSRPHLIRQLDQATERTLTLISAPAGFGKTTLLSEWIAHSPQRVVWLSLDEGDNDPMRFWAYVIAALQSLRHDLGADALALLRSPQPPSLESVLTILLNDIAALPDACSLIFDDYHVIDAQAIHTSLNFLLEHLPERMRVIITTRADPPLFLSRLRVKGQLLEIRASDLRFTPDETTTFFQQSMGLHLAQADVAALDARTEGWVAGLQLAALSLQGHHDAHRFVSAFAGSHHYIFDYLVDEVLSHQADDVQRFLLLTAVLNRLCAPLCQELTGQPDVQLTLEHMERANLFLVPLDAQREWYRYHPLFAEALRARLQQSQPGILAELHRRAAQWHQQHGSVAEALHHALAASDFERAADLIERNADAMRLRGELDTLQAWLDRLPAGLLSARPRLNLIHAGLLIGSHDLNAAESYLQTAERIAGESAAPGILSEVLLMRVRIAHRHNDFAQVLELTERALALTPAENFYVRGQLLLNKGSALYYSDRFDESLHVFEEVARLALQAGDISAALNALNNQGILETIAGQFTRAAQTYRRALQWAAEHDAARMPVTGMLHTQLGRLLYEANDLDAADMHLREAIARIDRGLDPYQMILSRAEWARVRQAQGDSASALQTIHEAMRLADKHALRHLSTVDAIASLVSLYVAQNRLSELAEWMQRSNLHEEDALSPLQEPEHIAFARALIVLGQAPRALKLLARMLPASESGRRVVYQVEIEMLQALGLQACAESDRALRVLQHALTLAQGRIRLFVDAGEPMRQLLTQLRRDDGDLRGYIDALLDAFERDAERSNADEALPVPAPTPVADAQRLLEPLTERELDVLRLVAQGHSNREIGERLVVSTGTVKKHLNNIFGKLGATSRTQALARARELGLV